MWIPKWYFEIQADRMNDLDRRMNKLEAHYSGKYEMKFSEKELARLNHMISIALMSGKIEFDEVSESVHQKVAQEICKQVQDEIRNEDSGS